jgi:hypothetical protein
MSDAPFARYQKAKVSYAGIELVQNRVTFRNCAFAILYGALRTYIPGNGTATDVKSLSNSMHAMEAAAAPGERSGRAESHRLLTVLRG